MTFLIYKNLFFSPFSFYSNLLIILQQLNILLLVIPIFRINIVVKKFSPMWNPKVDPIRLTMYIKTAPMHEFKTIFSTFFIGTINSLPNINKKHIQAKKVIIFVFIMFPPCKK